MFSPGFIKPHKRGIMKSLKWIGLGMVALCMTAPTVHADETDPGNNFVMASDQGQAYLIYGNLVQATSNASQTVSGLTVNVYNNAETGSATSNQSNASMTSSVGVAYGSGVVQINNSASAMAVGGNY